jgi:multimeric flavodoxin WrbA
MSYDKIIIHDLASDDLHLLPTVDNYFVIDASIKAANCIGCFGCWLKTPGLCVIKDTYQYLGAIIPQSREIVIVSQSCYGGYSPNIKRVLDRSIAASLPFFTYRGGKTHHIGRYKNRPDCTVFLYGKMSDFEKQIANELVKANGNNMAWQNVTLSFLDDVQQLGEVWQ